MEGLDAVRFGLGKGGEKEFDAVRLGLREGDEGGPPRI
jgi:hypothetical protein